MGTKSMIVVMQAFLDGEVIQKRAVGTRDVWVDITDEPTWDYTTYEYRIKPTLPALTYAQWQDLDYQVARGETHTGRDTNGQATFTIEQVFKLTPDAGLTLVQALAAVNRLADNPKLFLKVRAIHMVEAESTDTLDELGWD